MKFPFNLFSSFLVVPLRLENIDTFYKNAVSKMPSKYKINYCESLIYRVEDDIKHCECKRRKKELKRLLKASNSELLKLKNSD